MYKRQEQYNGTKYEFDLQNIRNLTKNKHDGFENDSYCDKPLISKTNGNVFLLFYFSSYISTDINYQIVTYKDITSVQKPVSYTHLDVYKRQRYYYWEEEKLELMPLPSMHYEYMERKTAKVSSDFHVRFDNAYYSVDKAFLHKKVSIKASSTVVRIYSLAGEFLCE